MRSTPCITLFVTWLGFVASPLQAFTLRADVDAGARWESMPITLQMTTQNRSTSITDGSEVIAIQKAAKTWSHVSGSSLAFQSKPTLLTSACSALYTSRTNVICFFTSRAQIQAILGSTIGSSVVAISGTSSAARLSLSGAFIFINEQDYVFRTDQFDPTNLAAFDLEAVILRELGHVAGLGSSLKPSAVMHPLALPEDSNGKRTLHEDDIRGVQFLYPANEVFPGGSCGTIQLNSLYFYLGFLFIGLIWMTLRRRTQPA